MKKLVPLLFLLAACGTQQTNTASLEVLESKRGIALDHVEKKLIAKKNPASLKKLYDFKALAIEDIICLSQVGISDHFILGYIEFTEKNYNLSSNDVRRLERSGVSQNIIHTLLQACE
jgi:hypothetical protein